MMSKAGNEQGKIQKPFATKPTGEKSGTAAYSKKGKPAESNWKKPNG